jgi:adenosylcobinamide-phosphate synthase
MSASSIITVWSGISVAAWISLGVVIDFLFGDLRWNYHPVRWICGLVDVLERGSRAVFNKKWALRIAGTIMTLFIVMLVMAVVTGLLAGAYQVSVWLFRFLVVFLVFAGVSVRGVSDSALAVYVPLLGNHYDDARYHLAMMSGQDTSHWSNHDIVRGTIETVAGNTCHGIVGPLFYGFLGGPVWLWGYKTVNTINAMIGKTLPQYCDLGWFAKNLDKLFNWIPARLTSWSILLAAGLEGRFRDAYQVMREDGHHHPLPNQGLSEAAMVGALGVGLCGANNYGGVVALKPKIGNPERPLVPRTIIHAVTISIRATVILIIGFSIISVMWTGRWL